MKNRRGVCLSVYLMHGLLPPIPTLARLLLVRHDHIASHLIHSSPLRIGIILHDGPPMHILQHDVQLILSGIINHLNHHIRDRQVPIRDSQLSAISFKDSRPLMPRITFVGPHQYSTPLTGLVACLPRTAGPGWGGRASS